jgi:hypothetical protein
VISVRRDRRRPRLGEEDGSTVGREGDVHAALVSAAGRVAVASVFVAAVASFVTVVAAGMTVSVVAAGLAVAIITVSVVAVGLAVAIIATRRAVVAVVSLVLPRFPAVDFATQSL